MLPSDDKYMAFDEVVAPLPKRTKMRYLGYSVPVPKSKLGPGGQARVYGEDPEALKGFVYVVGRHVYHEHKRGSRIETLLVFAHSGASKTTPPMNATMLHLGAALAKEEQNEATELMIENVTRNFGRKRDSVVAASFGYGEDFGARDWLEEFFVYSGEYLDNLLENPA